MHTIDPAFSDWHLKSMLFSVKKRSIASPNFPVMESHVSLAVTV